jgi:hypothetical protein
MIQLKTTLTRKAYIRLMYTLSFRSPAVLFVYGIIFLGFIIAVIGLNVIDRKEHSTFVWLVWIQAVYVIYYMTAVYRRSKKHYESNQEIQGEMHYEFGADLIRSVSKTSSGEMKWTSVHKVLELKNWVIIFLSNATACMIPAKDFGTQLPAFRTLVKNTGVKARLRK